MIAKLTGVIDAAAADHAVVDVGGVGYLVYCSGRTLDRLPPVGAAASLAIETHVREDHIHLYGFADEAERDWFRLLTTVQGVGARVALAILTALSAEQLIHAIAAQDKAALTGADGVGPKLAARILTELKDKAGGLVLGPATAGTPDRAGLDDHAADAVSALVNLGYGRSQALTAVLAASRDGAEASTESLIRAGLKELAQ